MSEKQYVFRPDELALVSCECPSCGTIILLDVKARSGTPDICPSCSTDLASFSQAVAHYRAFQREAAKLKLKLRTAPKPSDD